MNTQKTIEEAARKYAESFAPTGDEDIDWVRKIRRMTNFTDGAKWQLEALREGDLEFDRNKSQGDMPRRYEHLDRVDLWIMAQEQYHSQMRALVGLAKNTVNEREMREDLLRKELADWKDKYIEARQSGYAEGKEEVLEDLGRISKQDATKTTVGEISLYREILFLRKELAEAKVEIEGRDEHWRQSHKTWCRTMNRNAELEKALGMVDAVGMPEPYATHVEQALKGSE